MLHREGVKIIIKIKKLFYSKNENALAFFNILGPVVLNGINFFTIPIFTAMLGTENFGVVSIYSTWVQIFSIIMGIQTGGTIAVARANFEEKEFPKYYSSVIFLSTVVASAVFGFILIFRNQIGYFMRVDIWIVIIMALQSFGTYIISFATLKFTYSKQASKNFFISILVSVLSIGISLILIFKTPIYENRYIGRIVGYAAPNIVIGFILLIHFLYKGRTLYHKQYWKFCLPLCLPLIFHNLSQIILGQSNRILLQHIINDDSMVGVYSFIFTFVNLLGIIWGALNNTWVPFYYDDVKAGNKELILKKSKNYLFLYTILCIGFILLSPEVIKIFSSSDFWVGTMLIPIVAFSNYMVFLYSFPVNFEFYHKKTVLIAVGTFSAALVNIILGVILITPYGILGAALASFSSYVGLFIFHHIIAKYILKHEYHYSVKFFIPGIFGMIAASVFFYVTIDFWFIRWTLGLILGIILVIRVYRNRGIF